MKTKNKSSRTPGKWFMDGIEVRSKSRKETIGKIFSGGLSDISEEEGLANQKLVCGAPEMLFMMKKTMSYFNSRTNLTPEEIDLYQEIEYAFNNACHESENNLHKDITIDASGDAINIFLNPKIGVGSTVVVLFDGGHFSSHPDRRIIDGIKPHYGKKYIDLRGKKMKVLSMSETLRTEKGGQKNAEVEVIVLTDGKYSYWFSYYNEEKKSWIQLVS